MQSGGVPEGHPAAGSGGGDRCSLPGAGSECVACGVMSCFDCPCACSRLAVSPDVCVDAHDHHHLPHSDAAYQPLSRVQSESVALESRTSGMVPLEGTRSDDYEVWSPLATVCGDRGTVWMARHKPSESHVALKIYELDKCEDEFELIQDEVRLVRQLRHPNIMRYLASFTTGQQLWVVMPLLGFTSASRLVATNFSDGLPEPALALLVKDTLQGLSYLHSRRIVHRAVRGSHILIDSTGKVVLSGLRHSTCILDTHRWKRTIHRYPPEARCNLNWASPELLAQDLDGYCEKSDIYSLGITMCELGNGEVPYRGIPTTLLLLEKLENRVPFLFDASTYPQISENGQGLATDSGVGGSVGDNLTSLAVTQRLFSPAAHDFVSQSLCGSPHHRPSAERLLNHPFIKQTRRIHTPLPVLLHPVVPLTETTEVGEIIPDLLERTLEQTTLNDDVNWEF
ncbi:hypothetical protein Pmani_009620 [Petrolisthes manimaculis]|uniref:Protein kinase domain-containing protein n=1 Tax=Petrolisthes manimaculis TaxID=1843537 RepID=A0AAE1Q3S2_9EUCA|nr:hypothetical protein Pmani_009620 [Petrolisthes manimaculis]